MLVTVCPDCGEVNSLQVKEYGTVYSDVFVRADGGIALDQVDASVSELVLFCGECDFEVDRFDTLESIEEYIIENNIIQESGAT